MNEAMHEFKATVLQLLTPGIFERRVRTILFIVFALDFKLELVQLRKSPTKHFQRFSLILFN